MSPEERKLHAETNVNKQLYCFAVEELWPSYHNQTGTIKRAVWQHGDVGFYIVEFPFGEGAFNVDAKNIYQIL